MTIHKWYHLEWFEWIGLVLAVFGIPLTLYGLRLTWKQARAAKTAADAAREAVKRTQSQLRTHQLMVFVPQLRWIAQELDAAIELGNVPLTRRFLDSWRSHAGQVQGLLSKTRTNHDLIKQIGQSVGLAASADSSLFTKPDTAIDSTAVIRACQKARTAIRSVCDGLHLWIGENSTNVDSEEESK